MSELAQPRPVPAPVGQRETQQGQADPTRQKHVGDRGAAPADPTGTQSQEASAEGGPSKAITDGLLGRREGEQQAKERKDHGSGRQGRRQSGRPFTDAEQLEAEADHPVPPDGVVKKGLAVPAGGDPVTAQDHLARHLDKESFGFIKQTQAAQLVKKGQQAKAKEGR